MCHTWGLACSPAELQSGDDGDGGDVPDIVHLVKSTPIHRPKTGV